MATNTDRMIAGVHDDAYKAAWELVGGNTPAETYALLLEHMAKVIRKHDVEAGLALHLGRFSALLLSQPAEAWTHAQALCISRARELAKSAPNVLANGCAG